MQLYNYEYDDMRDLTFSTKTEATQLISKIYPTKLEVRMDEDLNRPYLYYEGIVNTNKGMMKITFPRLELVLNNIHMRSEYKQDDYFWFKCAPDIKEYTMTTTFNNLDGESVMYELRYLNSEESKEMAEQLWNGVKIVEKSVNSED